VYDFLRVWSTRLHKQNGIQCDDDQISLACDEMATHKYLLLESC
jgi:hypothetical protein